MESDNSRWRFELDNPYKHYAQELDNSWWKIFALDLDNSNLELDTCL